MTDTIRAFLIDPFAVKLDAFGRLDFTGDDIVREVTVPNPKKAGQRQSLNAIYAHLSHEKHPVDLITGVYLPNGDCIYVDDEGLFKEGHDHWFRLHGFPDPLKGRGLLVGTDREGDSVSPSLDIEQLRRNVQIGFDFTVVPATKFERNADGSVAKRKVQKHELLTPVVRHFAKNPWGAQGSLRA